MVAQYNLIGYKIKLVHMHALLHPYLLKKLIPYTYFDYFPQKSYILNVKIQL